MRPKVEIAVSLVLLLILGVIAGSLGARTNQAPSADPRRSTFLAGPAGAKAYAQALELLQVRVDRFRRRIIGVSSLRVDSARSVLALLDPLRNLDGTEAGHLLEYRDRGGDLLLSGQGTAAVMRCVGFNIDYRGHDSTPVYRYRAGSAEPEAISWTDNVVLAASSESMVADSSDLKAGVIAECDVRFPSRVDTLVVTGGGRIAAARLEFDDGGGEVTLVADGWLFSNSRLRFSDAGLASLPMVAGRYQRIIFDEHEHGFGPSGSLLSASLDWSLRSPYGWLAWQLAVAGLLALLAGAIRFGVPSLAIERRRRSPLEHVRALATALSAARGSHVAVDLMIRGLRRRLSSASQSPRGDIRPWLEALAANVRSARSKQAVSTLLTLTRRAPVPDGVLRAANAVEDVWQDMKPPAPKR